MIGALVAPLLRAACEARARRFLRGLDDVAATQRELLRSIVTASSTTGYAQSLGLRGDADIEAFRGRVPIVDYAAFAPWIERQRTGETRAVSAGRLRCYEPTSGSGGARKWIPYNDALLGSFRSLFAIWADDLLRHRLRPRTGRVFISVSPAFGAPRGLDDDRDYLSPPLRALLGRFLVNVPPARGAESIEAFRLRLATALVGCAGLEVISVWNPSYLMLVLDIIESRDSRLLHALPPQRRALLEGSGAVPWTALWPRLQLVSCWDRAAAGSPARALAGRLPQAFLQGKGLLATEAPISVPLEAAGGCVPLVDEVFLEFEDAAGACHLLHELEYGRDYALIVTQRGGLLRYRLGDRVRVAGRYRSAPLLDFVGRADAVSDLVGEKLHEDLVASALSAVRGNAADGAFDCVLPVLPDHGVAHYVWLCDGAEVTAAEALDRELQAGLRYAEARALGQLGAPHVIAHPAMRRRVHDALVESGLSAGDIKERALITDLDVAGIVLAAIERHRSALPAQRSDV